MSAATVPLQLPVNVYDRLQSLAAREHTSPVEMIQRLVTVEQPSLNDLITRQPSLRGGRPIVAGTGITVRTVAEQYKLGLTPEEISVELPLTLPQVYAALAYYHLHTAEIEADLRADSEEVLKQEFGR